MQENKTIAVVHLVWMPFNIERFYPFIQSYKKFKDDTSHDLVIIFNGVKNDGDIVSYLDYLKKEGIIFKYFCLPGGQDIEAYFFTAKQLSHDYVLFLNSYTVLLAENWLKNYSAAFEDDKVKLVGSSGTWQSYYSTVFEDYKWSYEFKKPLRYNFRKYKLFLKTIFYWRVLFKPFPNPHVRTNAFMLKRTDFLERYPGKVDSKFKAYLFENGRKGLSNYFLKSNFKVVAIDKYGRTYEKHEWNNNNVFWQEEQQNLLVADNQTELYQHGTVEERKHLSKLAWGNK